MKKNLLYSVSAVKYDDLPKVHSGGVDIVYKIQELDDLTEELNILKEHKKELYDKHMAEIQKLDDERERQVLRCYYLMRMPTQDIANLLNLTSNHISKIKRKAIDNFLNELK